MGQIRRQPRRLARAQREVDRNAREHRQQGQDQDLSAFHEALTTPSTGPMFPHEYETVLVRYSAQGGCDGVFDKLWRRSSSTVMIVSEHLPDPALNSSFLRTPEIRLLNRYPDGQALKLARRKRPSLIIEDLQAPDQDGFAFRQQLRSDPGTRAIPLILVTEPELRDRAREACAEVVLLKPLKRNEFFKAVRRFIPLPKRRYLRYGANLRFAYTAAGQAGQAFSRDLSLNGAFLKTDRILALGTRIELRFHLPGAWQEICCRGSVVRVSSGSGPAGAPLTGFAVEFDEMADEDSERLETFIASNASARAHSP